MHEHMRLAWLLKTLSLYGMNNAVDARSCVHTYAESTHVPTWDKSKLTTGKTCG